MEYGGLYNASNWGNNPPDSEERVQHSRQRSGDDDDPAALHHHIKQDGDGDAGLLCPFYVRDRNTWRKCLERTLRNASDVRTHIWRVHMQEHCQKCGATFDDDESNVLLNEHIKAGECQKVPFCKPGVTEHQFKILTKLARSRQTKPDPASVRWETIWWAIFGDESKPNSLYASGDTVFVQRLLDICNIIKSGQWQRLAPASNWADLGEFELSVFERLINTARQLERLPDRIMSSSGSTHTMPEMPLPAYAAPGEGSPALASSSFQPACTQPGGRSTTLWPAGTPFQKQVPALGPDNHPYDFSTQLVDPQVPLPSSFPGGRFQPSSGWPNPLTPGQEWFLSDAQFDANQWNFWVDLPDEQHPPFNGVPNQFPTNEETYLYNLWDEL